MNFYYQIKNIKKIQVYLYLIFKGIFSFLGFNPISM